MSPTLSVDDVNAFVGELIQFETELEGPVLEYEWDFGDGSSTGAVPVSSVMKKLSSRLSSSSSSIMASSIARSMVLTVRSVLMLAKILYDR